MGNLKCLVTGTGRCGTVYMAKLLTSLGVPCGHESVFDWNGLEGAIKRLKGHKDNTLSKISQENCNDPNWIDPKTIQAESSYMSAPFLDNCILKHTRLVHVVRNPVDVINSFRNSLNYFQDAVPNDQWERFIYRHIPCLCDESLTPVDRTCLYYIKWNELIEEKLQNRGFWFHRIEDDISPVLDFLDISLKPNVFDNRTENTLRQKQQDHFCLELISKQSIKTDLVTIGEKYGYTMN